MKRVKTIGCLGVVILFMGQCLLFSAELSDADRLQQVTEHYKKGTELHAKKDYNGFCRHMEKALELMPYHRRLSYELARGYALTGKTADAVKHLNQLVELGIIYQIETEKDFDSLRKDSAFQAILTKVKEKKKPIVTSTMAFATKERDLIPEGIAYDPVEKTFYLSSLNKCKIVKVGPNGNAADFTGPRQDGLLPTVGMRVDPKNRVLWVCTGFSYPKDGIEKELWGTAGVYKYDLKTAKLIKKYMLPQKENHFLNDVALAPDGTAYFSDSHVPGIYRIDAKTDTIVRFAKLSKYMYPNGITYSPATQKIFTACVNFIAVIDAKTGEVSTLSHPDNIYIAGCDGLYYYNNSLIAIQNSLQMERVVRMELDKKQNQVVGFTIIERNNPVFDIPTTGVVAGNHFYFIANSQLNKFDDKGKLPPLDQLKGNKILKIKLN